MVLAAWTVLGGKSAEEDGRGRLGMADERKETRGQDDGRGGPALWAGGASWDECRWEKPVRGTILNKFPTCSESVELVADSLLDDLQGISMG